MLNLTQELSKYSMAPSRLEEMSTYEKRRYIKLLDILRVRAINGIGKIPYGYTRERWSESLMSRIIKIARKIND